jgi:hypothetical protein
LPAVARAATTIARGAPEKCFHAAFQALHDWAERAGRARSVSHREPSGRGRRGCREQRSFRCGRSCPA